MLEYAKPLVTKTGRAFVTPMYKTHPRYYLTCSMCMKYKRHDVTFFPPHDPANDCESGKGPHCTCDRCF